VDYVLFSDTTIRSQPTPSNGNVTILPGRRGIRIFTPDKEQLRENIRRSGHRTATNSSQSRKLVGRCGIRTLSKHFVCIREQHKHRIKHSSKNATFEGLVKSAFTTLRTLLSGIVRKILALSFLNENQGLAAHLSQCGFWAENKSGRQRGLLVWFISSTDRAWRHSDWQRLGELIP